jgi:hypothetical protein
VTGPVRIYRHIEPGDGWCYDDPSEAQAIVDWSDGHAYIADGELVIITNRGDVAADLGDTIIRNLRGHFYPCPPDDYKAGWRQY